MKSSLNIAISILICIFFYENTIAQQDFDNFQTLRSKGEIPKDFSSLTYQKIIDDSKSEKRNLSKNQKHVFLQGIHYGIDDILHSGLVIYGDEISAYIKLIADKLLEKDIELKSKLRFYTIKSNESNAFSTDQGIIFVTTGLISRLSNEAQLAFILAHEISHYTEKHVVESFKFRTNNKERGKNIRDLSIYTKEKEFEADRLAIKWYNEAGYNKNELISVFDILMNCNLPFENIEFPKTYFNTKEMFVPDMFFATKTAISNTNEDYNDSLSSHPNIKKRKVEINNEIKDYSLWGNEANFFGKEKFEYVRKICRFESIRTSILDRDYCSAIYGIFLLEKESPNSIYLQRMKAQSWVGLAQMKKRKDVSERKIEGEIAALDFFINKLNRDELIIFSLRQVYDLNKKNFSDSHLNQVYDFLINELAAMGINFEKYSRLNSSNEHLAFKKYRSFQNSIADSISKAKDSLNINFSNFYKYGIFDILKDSIFINNYNSTKTKIENNKFEKENNRIKKNKELSPYDRKRIDEILELDQLKINTKDFLIVEPTVYAYKRRKLNLVKSEKLKTTFSHAFDEASNSSEVHTITINREKIMVHGTELFNERSTLFNYMGQVYMNEKESSFPVDFELINDIKLKYGISKVIFSVVEYEHSQKLTPTNYLIGFFTFMLLPIYIPKYVIFNHETKMSLIVFDIEKGIVETGVFYDFKDTPSKYHIAAHLFDIFEKLKLEHD